MTDRLICNNCKFFDRQMPPIEDTGYCKINGVGHHQDFECTWQDDYKLHKIKALSKTIDYISQDKDWNQDFVRGAKSVVDWLNCEDDWWDKWIDDIFM